MWTKNKKSFNESLDTGEKVFYSTYASDIEGFVKKAKRNPRCPKCRMQRTRLWLMNWASAVRDRENEITHWVTRCACGAEMHVLND